MHKTVLLSNLFIYNRKATLLSTHFLQENTIHSAELWVKLVSRKSTFSGSQEDMCVCCFGVVALNLLFLLWWVSEFLFHVVCCCPSFCLFRKPAPPLPLLLHSKTCFSQFLEDSARQKPVDKRAIQLVLLLGAISLSCCMATHLVAVFLVGNNTLNTW